MLGQLSNAHFTSYSNAGPESTSDFVQAAEVTVPAVVHVTISYPAKSYNNPFQFNDPWGGLFGNPNMKSQPGEGSGSGVIITNDGYIATNNHVVEDADKVEVTLNDKRTYTVKVIGKDPNTDLALIKIDEKDLPYISYGNSDDVKVGQWVLAVGNPFNLTSYSNSRNH